MNKKYILAQWLALAVFFCLECSIPRTFRSCFFLNWGSCENVTVTALAGSWENMGEQSQRSSLLCWNLYSGGKDSHLKLDLAASNDIGLGWTGFPKREPCCTVGGPFTAHSHLEELFWELNYCLNTGKTNAGNPKQSLAHCRHSVKHSLLCFAFCIRFFSTP